MINPCNSVNILRSKKNEFKINIKDLNEGINSTENFFINKINNNIKWVIERTCDHNGGKLILSNKKKNIARCPMHDWQLNLKSLNYINVDIKKKKLNFKIENNYLIIENSEKYLELPKFFKKNSGSENKVKVQYLSHASVLIETGSFKMITDPWYFGPAFCNGWWLKKPPTFDLNSTLKEVNLIYISHNHPDHLHIETLKKINPNVHIVCPNFLSKSTEKLLKRLSFKNIINLEFNKVFQFLDKEIFFTLLKSGDFRDDSGIFISLNGKNILLNVDCNNLNFGILPKNIDLLLSSYAGGASGFPLCFDDYTNIEKTRIIKRNQSAQLAMVLRLIESSKPKFFMPYAGYFSEYAKRDEYIFKNNKKNEVSLIEKSLKLKKYNTKVINIENHDTIEFSFEKKVKPKLKKLNKSKEFYKLNQKLISKYIKDIKTKSKNINFDDLITKYFKESKFFDNLELIIFLTNNDFKMKKNGYIIDFANKKITVKKKSINKTINYFDNFIYSKKKILMIKVREDALYNILSNKLPFEDLLIGFQCRIKRKPNVYNVRFWNHFTNKNIDGNHFRYTDPCNSCEALLQKIF